MGEKRTTLATCDICGKTENLGWSDVDRSNNWVNIYICYYDKKQGEYRPTGDLDRVVCKVCLGRHENRRDESQAKARNVFMVLWNRCRREL